MNEDDTIFILDVFDENGNKSNGKDSYNKAIKNAINNYKNIKEAVNEEE